MRDNERGHLLISLDAFERPAKQETKKEDTFQKVRTIAAMYERYTAKLFTRGDKKKTIINAMAAKVYCEIYDMK